MVFNLNSKKELFLFLSLGNKNHPWYRDFLGRSEKLYCEKWKNASYFLNHDTLISTLPGTSWHSLFGLQNIFRKILFLLIYHLGNFDDLIQCGCWIIPKIILANLGRPIHNIVTIPVSSDPLILKTAKEGKKNTKSWISREGKELFKWNKKHFS